MVFISEVLVYFISNKKRKKRGREAKVNVLTRAAVKGSALLITTAHMKVLVNNFPCAGKLLSNVTGRAKIFRTKAWA